MADEAITGEPTYTAINDNTLMEDTTLGRGRKLRRVFDFQARQILLIYEALETEYY